MFSTVFTKLFNIFVFLFSSSGSNESVLFTPSLLAGSLGARWYCNIHLSVKNKKKKELCNKGRRLEIDESFKIFQGIIHCVKYARIQVFSDFLRWCPCMGKYGQQKSVDSVLTRKNTGQWKPVFSHILWRVMGIFPPKKLSW